MFLGKKKPFVQTPSFEQTMNKRINMIKTTCLFIQQYHNIIMTLSNFTEAIWCRKVHLCAVVKQETLQTLEFTILYSVERKYLYLNFLTRSKAFNKILRTKKKKKKTHNKFFNKQAKQCLLMCRDQPKTHLNKF